jgi:hypothetical protein
MGTLLVVIFFGECAVSEVCGWDGDGGASVEEGSYQPYG